MQSEKFLWTDVIVIIGMLCIGGIIGAGWMSQGVTENLSAAATKCEERIVAASTAGEQKGTKATADIENALRQELERRYEYLYRAVFNVQCDRAVCAMRFEDQWDDDWTKQFATGPTSDPDGRQVSTQFWTGPIGCTDPGDVPWVKCANNTVGAYMCLPPPGKEIP